jgi:hypothetical protein
MSGLHARSSSSAVRLASPCHASLHHATRVTTDDITSTNDSFPDKDFFPDIGGLYIDDMTEDAGTNANLNANVNPPATPYANCSYLFQFLLQSLVLALQEMC